MKIFNKETFFIFCKIFVFLHYFTKFPIKFTFLLFNLVYIMRLLIEVCFYNLYSVHSCSPLIVSTFLQIINWNQETYNLQL